MPFSNSEQISPIVYEVIRMQPKSILDVGCGLGMYGFLCRVYLDLYYDVNFFEKLRDKEKTKWSVRIDAIEGSEEYLPYIPKWAYNDVIVGNASEIIPGLKDRKYDLILALAILEHLSKEEGIAFLGELKKIGRKIILSVPKQWGEQAVPDNPYETHRSHWTDAEFKELGFNKFLPLERTWIAVYDPESERAGHTDERFSLNNFFKRIRTLFKR